MSTTLNENVPLIVVAVTVILLSSTNLTPLPRILTAFFSRLYLNTVIARRQTSHAADDVKVNGTVSGLFIHPGTCRNEADL